MLYVISEPPKAPYLVTPEKFAQLSARGAQITDEHWANEDGTDARGWLLRGNEGAPAVILLHRYGADRSYVLNLGVKLNETTDYTVLMPDLRAHGENPPIKYTTFSGAEINDIKSAIKFLRSAQTKSSAKLVGKKMGLYGSELGALVALGVGAEDAEVSTMVLESVPASSNHLLDEVISARYPFGSEITSKQSEIGTYLFYYNGTYDRVPACEKAKKVANRDVMLLAGPSAQEFQSSTSNLINCFSKANNIKSSTDLNPTGFDLSNASLQQADGYDNRVIYFFKESLDPKP